MFTTKSQYKKAHKKRDKLARRAGRATPGAKIGRRPGSESPATPMVTETSFAFGSFEQHTTGAGPNPVSFGTLRHAVAGGLNCMIRCGAGQL